MKHEIYFAAGCFWGAEKFFKLVNGVVETQVGYANGRTQNPTYQEVYTDQTGHAETVRVAYDPTIVPLPFLVKLFFKAIDPTSLNRQGEDEGTRYRTGVYYTNPDDKPAIQAVFEQVQATLQAPMQVELLPLQCFYTAEEYHQDYLDKNPTGYCHLSPELFALARKAKSN